MLLKFLVILKAFFALLFTYEKSLLQDLDGLLYLLQDHPSIFILLILVQTKNFKFSFMHWEIHIRSEPNCNAHIFYSDTEPIICHLFA